MYPEILMLGANKEGFGMNELLNSLSSFGGYAVLAGVLLIMQYKQDEWTRKYMEELRTSIDNLTAAIEKELKRK